MHGLRHFVHNQVKTAYEAVAPDPTISQFENKRVCLSTLAARQAQRMRDMQCSIAEVARTSGKRTCSVSTSQHLPALCSRTVCAHTLFPTSEPDNKGGEPGVLAFRISLDLDAMCQAQTAQLQACSLN